MRIRATVVKALAAGALLAGLSGAVVTASASAGVPVLNAFYVSPHGTSALSNDCSNKAVPCLTIAQAITQATDADVSSATIFLAKGAYNLAGDHNQDISLANTTIKGAGTANAKTGQYKSVIQDNSGTVITLSGSGDSLQDVSVNGDPTNAGGGATVGVLVEPGTTAQDVAVTNIDHSGSSAFDVDGGTLNGGNVGGTLCTAITSSAIAPGTYNHNAIVTLTKKIPKCAGTLNATPVTIGGTPFTVESAGNKALGLDSGTAPAHTGVPAGAEVVFDPTVASYTANGVLFGLLGGTVENSSITGSGAATLTGINAEGAFGGAVNVEGTTVAGDGAGISLEENGYTDGIGDTAGNTVTNGNAEGLVVDGQAFFGGTVNVGSATSTGSNAYTGSSAGIVGSCIPGAGLNITDTSGSGAGASLNVGILFEGVWGSSDQGDTASGGLGWLLLNTTCPGPTSEHSGDNNIGTTAGNNVSGSLVAGLVVSGPANPVEVQTIIATPVALGGLGDSTPQAGNTGNTFDNNSWSGAEAGLIDFNAFDGEVAPACTLGDLTLTSAVTAGTSFGGGGDISVSNSGPTCSLRGGTNLEISGLNQELYVTSTTSLLSASTGNQVPVQNFIWVASGELDGGAAATTPVAWDEVPISNTLSTSNTYGSGTAANSPSPDFNHNSAALSSALGDPGYYVG